VHEERKLKVVAIDGPSGAGKSTVARRVAEKIGLPYLDTGAMYRAVALLALRDQVPMRVEAEAGKLAETCASILRMENGDEGIRVFLGGEDISDAIRDPEISKMASVVAVIPAVRRVMVSLQRKMGEDGGGVVEGRDIGTVVFPDAVVKIFLTASPETRARRRLLQRGAEPDPEELEHVIQEQLERDRRDSTRKDSPLYRAPDAVLLDSTGLNIDEVVEEIVKLFRVRWRPVAEKVKKLSEKA